MWERPVKEFPDLQDRRDRLGLSGLLDRREIRAQRAPLVQRDRPVQPDLLVLREQLEPLEQLVQPDPQGLPGLQDR
jgi:hypothetical protein